MGKRKYDVSKLNGISIYHDDKNRVIYSPWFMKKGYILHNEDVPEYQNYSQSFLVAILIFMIMYYITYSLFYSFSLSVVYLLMCIGIFHLRCLKKAPQIYDYNKPQKDGYIVRQAKDISTKRLIVIALSCVFLAMFILFNALYQGYTGTVLVINYIFIALALLYGLLNIVILIYKKKNNLEDYE